MIVEILLATGQGQRAKSELRRQAPQLAAPQIVGLEVISALRRLRLTNIISRQHAQDAFRLFQLLRIQLYSHDPLLPRVWNLQDNITPYDAIYVTLAESLGGALWTADRRLNRACASIVPTEYFGEATQTA